MTLPLTGTSSVQYTASIASSTSQLSPPGSAVLDKFSMIAGTCSDTFTTPEGGDFTAWLDGLDAPSLKKTSAPKIPSIPFDASTMRTLRAKYRANFVELWSQSAPGSTGFNSEKNLQLRGETQLFDRLCVELKKLTPATSRAGYLTQLQTAFKIVTGKDLSSSGNTAIFFSERADYEQESITIDNRAWTQHFNNMANPDYIYSKDSFPSYATLSGASSAVEVAQSYNTGASNLCVTMLGNQIVAQGFRRVINDKTVSKIEGEFALRRKGYDTQDRLSSATNFSATAFNKYTQVNLLKSRALAARSQCNVGFIFNPEKLEPIKVAVPGDGWTSRGGKLQAIPTSKGSKTHYVSYETSLVSPKNKAYKGTAARNDNTGTIKSLVKHTMKHGWTGAGPITLHPKGSGTTNEILFMPKTGRYFDAVDYILVDNSIPNSKNAKELPEWDAISKLSQEINKPILLLEKAGTSLVTP